jgi:plasmid maintenance system killer protein
MTSRRVRQEIRGRSPVGCGGRRHSSGHITFSREGRTGTRMIKLSTSGENNLSTVSTVSAVRSNGSRGDQADRTGQYSIRINMQWRICFEWPRGAAGPSNVEIVDYH